MRTKHAAGALWLCATLTLAACEKPAEQTANASSGAQPGATKLYNAEPDAHWDLVANAGEHAVYTAPSSYQLLGDHRVAIAEKITQNPTASDPEAYTIWVMEFNCVRHTQTATGYVRYNSADQPIGHADFATPDQKEVSAADGTVGGAVAGPLCKSLGLE